MRRWRASLAQSVACRRSRHISGSTAAATAAATAATPAAVAVATGAATAAAAAASATRGRQAVEYSSVFQKLVAVGRSGKHGLHVQVAHASVISTRKASVSGSISLEKEMASSRSGKPRVCYELRWWRRKPDENER